MGEIIRAGTPTEEQKAQMACLWFFRTNDGSRVRSRTVQDVSATDKQRAIDRGRAAEYRLKQNTAALIKRQDSNNKTPLR